MDITKLLEQLPNRFGTPQKITDRLNEKRVLTPYNRQYTIQNVRNSLNGEHVDDNVILELVALVKEYKNSRMELKREIESALSV
jgi:hypothetical protein